MHKEVYIWLKSFNLAEQNSHFFKVQMSSVEIDEATNVAAGFIHPK